MFSQRSMKIYVFKDKYENVCFHREIWKYMFSQRKIWKCMFSQRKNMKSQALFSLKKKHIYKNKSKLLTTTILLNTLMVKVLLNMLGPVVQSVVSLTSLLRVISLTVLVDSIYNILIFFAEKNVSSFCTATFFQQKIPANLRITQCKFNESLTNDVISLEQLGPG